MSYRFSEILCSVKMYNYYGESKSTILLLIILLSQYIMPSCRMNRHRDTVTIINALVISDDP